MEQSQATPHNSGVDSEKPNVEPSKTTVQGGGDGGVVYKYKRGAWSKEEDEKLRKAVEEHGDHNWIIIERSSGLARPAKNCRLRWTNYLRPNLKKCPFTPEEENKILLLHSKYGNSWSRIASKLPGRSDNEIKNFWHKRAKKCLPIYPTKKVEDQQSHRTPGHNTNNDKHYSEEKNAIDEFWPKEHQTPTNYPKFTLPSSSMNSSEFQSSSLNVTNSAFFQPEASFTGPLGSPQTPMSTQPPQFLPSPRSLPCYQQSPTNQFSQTIPSPHTPASQPQNLLLSPHQNTTPQIQAPSPQQGGAGSNALPHRKPPILLPPRGRFKRFSRESSQISLSGSGSGSSVENASVLLNLDSSLQKHCSSAMESPRTPLILNLSPKVHELYSVHNQPDSSSVFHLKSPTIPLSPLNLRLSVPAHTDSTVQVHSSTAVASLPSPQSKPSYCSLDLSQVQQSSFSFDHDVSMDSSFTFKTEPLPVQFNPSTIADVSSSLHEVESESNQEILDALREAQAKVRFLKKMLKQSELMKKKEYPETTALIGKCLRTKNLIEESLRVNAPRKNSRTKDVIKIISSKKDELSGKISKTGVLLVKSPSNGKTRPKLQETENSESGNYTQDESTDTEELTRDEISEPKYFLVGNLQGEGHSLGESNNIKGKETLINQKQRQSADLYDHVNSQNFMSAPSFSDSWAGIQFPLQVPAGKSLNECSSIEGLQSESSTFVQDSFLMGELFGKTSGINGQLASDGQEHLIDAFGPIYSQNIGTTLEKSGNEGSQLSYLQLDEGGCLGIGRGFSDGMERRFTGEQKIIEGNLGETSKFCRSSLLLHQYPTTHMLDSNYMVSPQIMEYGHMGGEPYSQEPSGERHLAEMSKLCESNLSLNQYHTTNFLDSDHQVTSSMINECPEERMVSEEQKELIGSNNWNNESSYGSTGKVVEKNYCYGSTGKVPDQGQEHDLINTMPEELSSLLEFFSTSIHTPEWYYNGTTIPDTEASNEFNMDMNHHMSTTSPPVTFADFL